MLWLNAKGAPQSLARSGAFRDKFVYYVYILKLRDDTHYMGYSSELKSRIKNHIQGNIQQTKNLRPLKLVFYAAFESKQKALHFEQYLKTGSGFAFRNRHFM